MIRYLKHKEIDKSKWDKCIESSPNGLIYAMSWYLDIVSPMWDAIVEEDYITVIPVTKKRKYLIEYLVQPVFAQQLGIFGNNIPNETIKDFYIEVFKRYRFLRINLNYLNQGITDFEHVTLKNNYILELNKDYEITKKKYNKSNLNNIIKSENNYLVCKKDNEFNNFYEFVCLNYPYKYKSSDYTKLQNLLSEFQKRQIGTIYSVYDSQNTRLASALFIEYNNRIIYMFSSQTSKGRENKATFYLIDYYIRENSNKQLILDFEGSNIEGIASFFKGFGAINQPYYFLNKSNIPSILKKLIKK